MNEPAFAVWLSRVEGTSSRRARKTLPANEDLLLREFRTQVNQPVRVGGLTGGSAP